MTALLHIVILFGFVNNVCIVSAHIVPHSASLLNVFICLIVLYNAAIFYYNLKRCPFYLCLIFSPHPDASESQQLQLMAIQ